MRSIREGFGKLVKTRFNRIKLQDAMDPTQFIGRQIKARKERDQPDEDVTIKEVLGVRAITDPALVRWLQINGTHLCHALSFYTQLLENRIPSDEEIAEFDLATDIVKMKEIKNGAKKE